MTFALWIGPFVLLGIRSIVLLWIGPVVLLGIGAVALGIRSIGGRRPISIVSHAVEMFGNVGHRLGSACHLAASFVTARFQITTGRAVKVTGRLGVKSGIGHVIPFVEPADTVKSVVEIATRSLTGVFKSKVVGWGR